MFEEYVIVFFIIIGAFAFGVIVGGEGFWRKFYKATRESDSKEEVFCKTFQWSPLELIKNYFNRNFHEDLDE